MMIFDGHSDLLYDVTRRRLAGEDHVLERRHLSGLRAGGIGGLGLSLWTTAEEDGFWTEYPKADGWQRTELMMDCARAELTECPWLVPVRTAAEARRAAAEGKRFTFLVVEGMEPVGFWYNPNIHPMKEYKMRKNTLVEYAKSIDLKLEIENEYGLRKFIEAVYPNWDNRCATCYALRFEETARYAAEHGYDRFTSTLFVSPYQNHELMRRICEQMAEKYGVEYLHRDFSPRFREGQDKARELGLYMQNYCGCVFSEEDRYRKRKKKKKPDDAQA